MHIRINSYIRQAALLLLCGLLFLPAFAQKRQRAEMERTARALLQKAGMGGACKLRASASQLFPKLAAQQTDGEAFLVYTPQDTTTRGFVIVSGDQRQPAVLGYSETSRWNSDSIPPNVKYWLGTYCRESLSRSGAAPAAGLQEAAPEGVAPLLGDIQWGQGAPFNNQCPLFQGERCLTGCGATAMAQVMKYHGRPVRGIGSIYYITRTNNIVVSKYLPSYFFDWGNMRPDYSGNYSAEEAKAVATLMACCGAAIEMDYGLEASASYQYKLLEAYVDNFCYDSDASYVMKSYFSEDEWHALLLRELNEGRPVNYAGTSPVEGGHSFVVDGYTVLFSSEGDLPLYHVNWGWSGLCDGYYHIATLDPMYDGYPIQEAGYTDGQGMLLGIKPEDDVREYRQMLATEKMTASTGTILPGESLEVSAEMLMNFSYAEFAGDITAVLVGTDGTEIALTGERPTTGWKFFYYFETFSLTATVPVDCLAGSYRVELHSKANGAGSAAKVYAPSYPCVEVLAVSAPENVRIGAAELEAIAIPFDPKTFLLRAYLMTNLADGIFLGQARPVIADEACTPVTYAGDDVLMERIDPQGLLSDPVGLVCDIPKSLANGNYKLCVGVKGLGGSEYLLAEFYDMFLPDQNQGQPISLPLEVYDDCVVVDGQRFDLGRGTGIGFVGNDGGSCFTVTDNGQALVVRNCSDRPLRFSVHNAQGQLVRSFRLDGGSAQAVSLPTGLYLVGTEGDVRKIRKK